MTTRFAGDMSRAMGGQPPIPPQSSMALRGDGVAVGAGADTARVEGGITTATIIIVDTVAGGGERSGTLIFESIEARQSLHQPMCSTFNFIGHDHAGDGCFIRDLAIHDSLCP